jgi:DNA mismatch endonuclease (patch repair protein)
MARIGGRNTRPEIILRAALRSRGIGYRLHSRDLPGTPDVVMRGARLAVFVHGCFWHRHPGCLKATMPKTREEFWSAKFRANVARDRRQIDSLIRAGWRVGVVWECETACAADLALAVDAIEEIRLSRRLSSC